MIFWRQKKNFLSPFYLLNSRYFTQGVCFYRDTLIKTVLYAVFLDAKKIINNMPVGKTITLQKRKITDKEVSYLRDTLLKKNNFIHIFC